MNRPTLAHFGQINHILNHQYERYLPTAFDESMTLLQKVNKMIREMNRLGELTNDVVEQWNKVVEWLLEDGLGDEVITQLKVWLDDGTLARLINEELFARKPDIYVSSTEPVNPHNNSMWFEERVV